MKRSLSVLGLCALLAAGIASTVQALPPGGTGFDDVYYSDDTYSEIVGEHYMECNSSPSWWGVRTAYVDRSSWSCPEPAPTDGCTRYICFSEDQWGDPTNCTEVVGGCL